MKSEEKVDFCTTCRKETGYTLQKMKNTLSISQLLHAMSVVGK